MHEVKTTRVMIESQGEPDVMQLEDAELGAPAQDEVQIEQAAIGLNYMDIYQRSGMYRTCQVRSASKRLAVSWR